MLAFAYANFPHVLCALLLIARLGDVGTTYLLTPHLTLEANPIVRKLGWGFAMFTLAVCFLPYYSTSLAVSALILSLFVSASNAGKIWLVRTIGEAAYAALLNDAARKSKLSHALFCIAASAFFVALAGATILLLYPAQRYWGFWIGGGVLFYAVVIWVYGSLAMMRLFRRANLRVDALSAAE